MARLRLRPLWLAAPLLLGACSFLNAPSEVNPGTGSGGAAGTGGVGGSAGTSGGGTAGMAGMMTTDTTPMVVCGDGKVGAGEDCDDAGTAKGDGCDDKCAVEPGYNCTGEPSVCAPGCGNGVVDMAEECDDGGKGDDSAVPGDQDFCSPGCKFKEFDVETDTNVALGNQAPTAAYRDEAGASTFMVVWSSTKYGRLLGRRYSFKGGAFNESVCSQNMTPCMMNSECCSQQCTAGSCSGPILCTQIDASCTKDTECCSAHCVAGVCAGAAEVSVLSKPDTAGHRVCTGESKRSLVFWRDASDSKLYARKIESNGSFIDPIATPTNLTQPGPSCAAAPGGAFVGATVAKPGGALLDVVVQPYSSFAAPNGPPIDIGDTTEYNRTSAWPLSSGFLVAWIADPIKAGPIGAQQLDKDGKLMQGFVYQLSDMADVAPREPYGERIGMGDQFALTYTRDSAPDAMGNVHREVVVRIFQQVGDMGTPIILSKDTNPQSQPFIAADPAKGRFLVLWTGGTPGAENIYLRGFDAKGGDVTPEVIVPDNQVGQQTAASAAVDPVTGNVAVVWDSFVPNSGKPRKSSAKIFAGLLK